VNKKTVSQYRSNISAAVAHPSLGSVTFRINHKLDGLGYLLVRFHIQDEQFTVWHDVNKPNQYSYYVIPPYHPVMHDMKLAGTINGSTDYLIKRHSMIKMICSPDTVNKRNWLPSLTWHKMEHPFYARGHSIIFFVDPTQLSDAASQEELQKLLLALVGFENTYIEVSGGFTSPLAQSQYVAECAGIYAPVTVGRARGSESFCVWAYHTLQAEGQLADAFIPSWFESEGWLDAYSRFGGK
jgi:hypothetical protein